MKLCDHFELLFLQLTQPRSAADSSMVTSGTIPSWTSVIFAEPTLFLRAVHIRGHAGALGDHTAQHLAGVSWLAGQKLVA